MQVTGMIDRILDTIDERGKKVEIIAIWHKDDF